MGQTLTLPLLLSPVGGLMLNMVFQAASDGDLPLLKELVMKLDTGRGSLREEVEALSVEDVGLLQGLGALHVAAGRGRLEVCRYLVEELQVDVNGVDKEGDCETVKLLLAKGAHIDPVAFCGTPLHCAATHGHDGIMKILLDHNADAGADTKGALTYAMGNLHSEKLVSTDFVNCIKEDVAADRILPDDDYKGACDRFLDGLKLDPANTEIEEALRKAYDAMKDVPKPKVEA
ncbi:hypothetical protein ACQ4PT_035962 [Festuca glaucescens]